MIKLGAEASQSKCTLVYGQMNEPPGARARVALTGNTRPPPPLVPLPPSALPVTLQSPSLSCWDLTGV